MARSGDRTPDDLDWGDEGKLRLHCKVDNIQDAVSSYSL